MSRFKLISLGHYMDVWSIYFILFYAIFMTSMVSVEAEYDMIILVDISVNKNDREVGRPYDRLSDSHSAIERFALQFNTLDVVGSIFSLTKALQIYFVGNYSEPLFC